MLPAFFFVVRAAVAPIKAIIAVATAAVATATAAAIKPLVSPVARAQNAGGIVSARLGTFFFSSVEQKSRHLRVEFARASQTRLA